MQIVGVIGSLCFAFCLLPQVIKAYREKTTNGISWLFLLLSAVGNIASCSYVVYTNILSGCYQYPLYFNYGFALSLCVLLIVAKLRFKDPEEKRCEWLNVADGLPKSNRSEKIVFLTSNGTKGMFLKHWGFWLPDKQIFYESVKGYSCDYLPEEVLYYMRLPRIKLHGLNVNISNGF